MFINSRNLKTGTLGNALTSASRPLIPVSPLQSRSPSLRSSSLTACPISRSEEHTSELQSPCNLVCRLLLEKKKKNRPHNGEALEHPDQELEQKYRERALVEAHADDQEPGANARLPPLPVLACCTRHAVDRP